jgi:hypothetical protein
MDTLSTVRAYVGGESLWSKGQKDAIYFLTRYTITHQEEEFQKYKENIKVPLGDRLARIELQKRPYDLRKAEAGFLKGKNHPDDVHALALFFIRYHRITYLKNAIDLWAMGDLELLKIEQVADEIHTGVIKNKITPQMTENYLQKIDQINKDVTELSNQFLYTLGEAARWLAAVLFWITFLMACLFLIAGFWVSIAIAQNILKSIEALKLGTIRVERGLLTVPIQVNAS